MQFDIPNYQISKSIGQGGMATVYLATHQFLDRQVALKVISPSMAMDDLFQNQLIKEGQTVAALDHPHIVKIYDVGKVDGQFYMAMELLSGGGLEQKIKQGALSVDESISILKEIAKALTYAHSKSLIHRDIKPSNILFRSDNSAVLTDFGIAKQQDTEGDLTRMGYVVGSPSYMSPEQIMGEHLDHRTDIYSLAIVLYEMLTGERPYTGKNTAAINYQQLNKEIPQLPRNLEYLQSVLNKGLAKDLNNRYTSANEFIEALETKNNDVNKTQVMQASSNKSSYNQITPDTKKDTEPSISKINFKWVILGISSILAASLLIWGLGVLSNNSDDSSQELNILLTKADKQWDKSHYFNYQNWTNKCQQKLKEKYTYDAANSAEALYNSALAISPKNSTAKTRLDYIKERTDSFQDTCKIKTKDISNTKDDDTKADIDNNNSNINQTSENTFKNAREEKNLIGQWHFVTASKLTIRTEPHRNATKIKILSSRNKVRTISNTVYKETINGRSGDWVKIKSGNIKGYVFNVHLEKILFKSARIFKRIKGQHYIVIAKDFLNLRKTPNSKRSINIVDVVNKHEVIQAISNVAYPKKEHHWIKVKYKGQTGFMLDRHLMPLIKYKDKITRLNFSGSEKKIVSNIAKGKGIKTYVLRIMANQTLNVNFLQEATGKAILNIYGDDNRVLSYGESSVSVIIPKNQNYFVSVIPQGNEAFEYDLEFIIPADN